MGMIVWGSIVLAVAGTILLRFAGPKAVSQMTTPQLAILLSIGTILGSEVASKGLLKSIVAVATFIAFLIAVEWITLKWNRSETLLKGKSITVISDGRLLMPNLRRLRLSVDDLEKRLRMAGISRIDDVKFGTIENNGELGYELMPSAKPVTMGDLEQILRANFPQIVIPKPSGHPDLFTEVRNGPQPDESASRRLH